MEGTIGDAQQCLQLRIVGVFSIAIKERQSCNEISLLDKMGCVWQLELFLLKNGKMKMLEVSWERIC